MKPADGYITAVQTKNKNEEELAPLQIFHMYICIHLLIWQQDDDPGYRLRQISWARSLEGG